MKNEKTLSKIRRAVKKLLDRKRYEHTLGVAYTAAALAMCHGADLYKAQLAGLLHDCAKCVDDGRKLEICAEHGLAVSETERRNPFLLHAKVGSFIATHELGISDGEVNQAILSHITGRPAMTLLEKIVFIADFIEPGRGEAPCLPTARQEAFRDLDKALVIVLEDILAHLAAGGGEIDPMTRRTYEYYKS
ncbi:MAG: bis(5'-nucleosyl)-tetraphosphatase (symmetrical) YqeK [Lachnospiraceae bacterium]|nr:bis(5'-nucleosyl)-tetraphosphatase (symmetrical) YqeK [Lachnospiraceae bacterium]